MITVRPAASDDLDTLLATLQAGFDSYRSFAPEGWEPPQVRADRAHHEVLLVEPTTRAWIAVIDGQCVGHVSFYPARERRPDDDFDAWRARPVLPRVAHLWQLFVLPPWWGQGVAPVLHDTGIAAMRADGYESARLLTPSAHARACRFYERRGWRAVEEQWHDGLGLTLTEYRLALAA